jgi:FAD/FMN-containing dehydrogenase
MSAELIAQLGRIVGPSQVLCPPEDLASYEEDWRKRWRGRALAVVRPGSTAEVAAVVKACAAAGVTLVPQGGNTGLVGGGVPDDQGRQVLLSLRRMTAVRALDADNLTLTVEAGCVLQVVQAAAEARGLLFPLSLAAEGSCTIGGNLATNAGGTQVLRFGNARDLCLGLEVVTPTGEIWDGLSGLRKDNTGYDLRGLFIGSEGTLGVITRALLALQPLPVSRQSALVTVAGFDAVTALLTQCRQRLGPRLSSFEVMWRDFFDISTGLLKKGRPGLHLAGSHVVLVEAMGMDAAADDALFAEVLGSFQDGHAGCEVILAQSLADAQAIWSIREAAGEAAHAIAPCVGFDVSLPMARMATWTQQVHAELRAMGLTQTQTYGHLGDGNLHLLVGGTGDPAVAAAVDDLVYRSIGAQGGSISGEHGIGLSKKAHLHHCRSAAEIATMKRMKTSLDPHGILNRGRIFDLP